MVESSLLACMRVAAGATIFRRLPVPRLWDSVKRPHVALLESINDEVFCFFLSQPSKQNRELSVSDIENLPSGSIVEVRYSEYDYRYYRRDGQMWRMIAEARSQFFIEVYDHGETPVVVPLSDTHILTSG